MATDNINNNVKSELFKIGTSNKWIIPNLKLLIILSFIYIYI